MVYNPKHKAPHTTYMDVNLGGEMKRLNKRHLAGVLFALVCIYIISFAFAGTARDVEAADGPIRFYEGYWPDVLWGLHDGYGNVIVPPVYYAIGDFHEGFAPVASMCEYGRVTWGFIDSSGRVTVSLIYDEVSHFLGNRAPVRIGYRWGLINRAGQIVSPIDNTYDEVRTIAMVMSHGYVPEYVEKLHWHEVRRIFPYHVPTRITDVGTGIYFYVITMSNGNHADVETITPEDTDLLFQAFGGVRTWTARPVWVTIGDRTISAALHSMPHAGWVVHGNNMDGHLCLHFYGSTTHNTNQPVYHYTILQSQWIFDLYAHARDTMAIMNAPPVGSAASPDLTTVMIDTRFVTFQTFRIGAGVFFRIEDLAYALNGTEAQFNFDWYGNVINIASNEDYIANGTEMAIFGSSDLVSVRPARVEIYLDGERIHPMSFIINESTMFMLNDFGPAIGLGVEVDDVMIRVSTR